VNWFIAYLSSNDADIGSVAMSNKLERPWKDRGRTRKQFLDDLKEKREYCEFKDAAALDRNLWRALKGRGCGHE